MSLSALPRIETAKLSAAGAKIAGPAVVEVVSGEIVVRADGADSVRVVAGDLVLVGSDKECRIQARPRLAEVIRFAAAPEWAGEAARLAGTRWEASALAFRVERRRSDVARRVRALLRRLDVCYQSRAPGHAFRALALAAELVACGVDGCRVAGEVELDPRRAGGRRRLRLLEALGELETAPLDQLSLPRFAARLGLGGRQVSRLFREEFGCSFRDYAGELRLERAKKLLRETDQPVIEVAGAAGWRSLSHFNSVFRRRLGVTPSAFRARERGLPHDGPSVRRG